MATPKQKSKKTKPTAKASYKSRHIFKNAWFQLGLALILFSVSAVFVHDRDMTTAERAVFSWAYNLPDFLFPIFFMFSRLADIYLFLGFVFLVIVKKFHHIATRLLLAGLSAYLLTGVFKDLIGRARPEAFLDVVYLDVMVRGSGFPSGHTALATAAALTLAAYLPRKWQWIAPVVIIGVAMSRMVLGVHGPMDLVGGFAIGWFAFTLTRFVSIKISLKGE